MSKEKLKPTKVKAATSPVSDAAIYFQSLAVRNLRCFGEVEQTLKLSRADGRWSNWTIILGNNGTGKSTLLQMIASIAVFDPKELTPANDESTKIVVGESQNINRVFGVYPRIVMEWVPEALRNGLLGVQVEHIQKFGFTANATVGPKSGDLRRQHVAELTCDGNVHKADLSAQEFDFTVSTVNPAKWRLRPRLLCVGYGAWRHIGESTLTRQESSGPYGRRTHLFFENTNLLNPEEWLLRLELASKEGDSSYAVLLDSVKAALMLLLPDIIDIRVLVIGKQKVEPRTLFRTEFGWVPLRKLGYGYQSLIAWVVDFAAALFEECPDSENPLGEPAVCLVDEIDLHLHPTWQRNVMQHLSSLFPQTQFIATAHSPLIVQAAPEVNANVAVLRRVGDHVEICNDPIDVKGWRADQILASELFDELPLRAKTYQAAVDERIRLLSKSELSDTDEADVERLNKVIDAFPNGSDHVDRAFTNKLKEAVEILASLKRNGK